MVTDFCGDTVSDYVAVSVIMDCKLNIPNVFTPNGDGKNDVFLVTGVGMQTYSISIFDRWGKKVFESNDLTSQWDGKIKGNEAEEGVYFWLAHYRSACVVDAEQIENKGFVHLLRKN